MEKMKEVEMTKEEYIKECKKWEEYIELSKEYYEKREKISRSVSDYGETVVDLFLDLLEKSYGWDGFNPIQFGPFTKIYSSKQLKDPNFILPGHTCSYAGLKEAVDQNLPYNFGKLVKSKELLEQIYGRVIGFGYDSSDYYVLIENEEGVGSINMLLNFEYI